MAHEPALVAQLERARRLGFFGPGPVADHLEHAAGFVAALHDVDGRIVDLGSGGGIPGLPIALARPDLALVLVDATAKRCRFLEEAIRALGLGDRMTVVQGRAEAIGRGDLRGAVDAVVARSFGPPAATAECAAPLLRIGGRLVVSEPPEAGPRWSTAGLVTLGMALDGPPTSGPRLQRLLQVAECSDEYPRRDGIPAKRPLF